jgi:thiol-disulfide isomerase/thioredoxin
MTLFRRRSILTACLTLCIIAASAFKADEPSGEVVQLTDDNFDKLTEGGLPWMVAVTAPWCTHCQDLEPIWRALAQRLKGEVHVGKIDSTTELVLQQRFGVEAYPSLYFLKDGETRECHVQRTLQKLSEFAEDGWRSVTPVPRWKSPVSPSGRALGKLRMVPYAVRKHYRYLHHEKKFGVLTLLAGFLSVPILFGVLSICLLDAYFTRSAKLQHAPVAHPHHAHQH